MLVDLNKEEINYLVNVLNLNNSEIMNKEETNFSSNLYLKLRNLSTVCTCKEANSMKWDVKLFVAGSMFTEQVHATNMQDARQTALARNPSARVVSVTVSFK